MEKTGSLGWGPWPQSQRHFNTLESAESTFYEHAAKLAAFVRGFVQHYLKNAMVQPARCEA